MKAIWAVHSKGHKTGRVAAKSRIERSQVGSVAPDGSTQKMSS
ncbi:MAG: hypothetical protein RM022_001785 [Nostoc sp. EfeVER01]|nr:MULTISPECIES: hypothetical protein [unclassified Nostoc]MDZ7947652.1 hypothetical protein [Nostoc sp. EfeVER01]MDZ7994843.1 hypothetical protein [Nostoc sp. EspVER01]